MDGPLDRALRPLAPSLPAIGAAAALLAVRLADAQRPADAAPALRVAVTALIVGLALLPPLVELVLRRRRRRGEWLDAQFAATGALAALAALAAGGMVVRAMTVRTLAFAAPQAPWPIEPLAAAAALQLAVHVLPFPGGAGATLLESALRRQRPQLVAARLAARAGFALWLTTLPLFALVPGFGSDPLALATAGATACACWREQRRAARAALAREWALQHHGAWQLPGVRALAPAQFAPFAGAAAAAYAADRGARMKQAKPAPSASSSSTTGAA